MRRGLRRWIRLDVLDGRRADEEVEEELALHIEHRVEQLTAQGMSERDAREEAERRVGTLEGARDRMKREAFARNRKARGSDSFVRDIVLAFRSMRRAPVTVMVAVASLAIGIGALSAMFTLASAVYMRPLPYDSFEQLVMIWRTNEATSRSTSSPMLYDAVRSNPGFANVAAYNVWYALISGDGAAAQRLNGSIVTPSFFRTLGVSAAMGRVFSEDDARPGHDHVLIISDELWRSRYGGVPDVIGRTVQVSGDPWTIIGVLPAGYRHPEVRSGSIDAIAPLAFTAEDLTSRSTYLRIIGRTRASTPMAALRAQVASAAQRIASSNTRPDASESARVVPLADDLYEAARPALRLLFAGGVFILLIVVVNIANLVVGRNQGRMREFAVRAALGAGSRRIVRQVLSETLMIAFLGGAIGIALVHLSRGILVLVMSRYIAGFALVTIDWRVIVFTTCVSALAALACGWIPALRASRADIRSTLFASRGGTNAAGAVRTREFLVVLEIALTVVLLSCALLLGRSFVKLTSNSIGFSPTHVLTAEVMLPAVSGDTALAERRELVRRMIERMHAIPGVKDVAVTSDLPFTQWNSFSNLAPIDNAAATIGVEFHRITAEYFRAMSIRVRSGVIPDVASPGVAATRADAVINEALAKRFWPGENPVGRRVSMGSGVYATSYSVAAVVEDVRDDGYDQPAEPRIYLPYEARPGSSVSIVVRTSGGDRDVIEQLEPAVHAVNPDVAISNLMPMTALVGETIGARTFALISILAFSAVAILLAAIGIYGITAYSVGERVREIGIRQALGASSAEVLMSVLTDALRLAGIATAAGVVLTWFASRAIAGQLYEVRALDPGALGATVLLLVLVTTLSALLPARRAARIQPMAALRQE